MWAPNILQCWLNQHLLLTIRFVSLKDVRKFFFGSAFVLSELFTVTIVLSCVVVNTYSACVKDSACAHCVKDTLTLVRKFSLVGLSTFNFVSFRVHPIRTKFFVLIKDCCNRYLLYLCCRCSFSVLVGTSFFLKSVLIRRKYDSWCPDQDRIHINVGMLKIFAASSLYNSSEDLEIKLPKLRDLVRTGLVSAWTQSPWTNQKTLTTILRLKNWKKTRKLLWHDLINKPIKPQRSSNYQPQNVIELWVSLRSLKNLCGKRYCKRTGSLNIVENLKTLDSPIFYGRTTRQRIRS